MSATLDAVLQYAGRGWSMFPGVIVGKLKKSHLKGEFSNDQRWGATDKPRVLQRYWRRWPDALIGLPTGRENGFFVVDATRSRAVTNTMASQLMRSSIT